MKIVPAQPIHSPIPHSQSRILSLKTFRCFIFVLNFGSCSFFNNCPVSWKSWFRWAFFSESDGHLRRFRCRFLMDFISYLISVVQIFRSSEKNVRVLTSATLAAPSRFDLGSITQRFCALSMVNY